MKKYVVSAIVIGCFSLVLAEDAKQIVSKATNAPAASVATPQTKKEESYPVIGYLEKRDRVITIKSSPQGTIYSIATKDGKILHENLSAEQLKAQAPELYEMIKTGTAGDASKRPQVQGRLDGRF
jgi:hypothetical protein